MTRPALHAVPADPPAPADPLRDQQRIALATLAFGAEAASRFGDAADTLDRLSPYVRELLRRHAVADAASIALIHAEISKKDPRHER